MYKTARIFLIMMAMISLSHCVGYNHPDHPYNSRNKDIFLTFPAWFIEDSKRLELIEKATEVGYLKCLGQGYKIVDVFSAPYLDGEDGNPSYIEANIKCND